MPRIALALVFGGTLYVAASAVMSPVPAVTGSILSQAMSAAMVIALHVATGFLILADKAGISRLLSRKAIGLAALSLAATMTATAAAALAAFVRPVPISAEFAAPALALTVCAAAACTMIAARCVHAGRAVPRSGATLQRG